MSKQDFKQEYLPSQETKIEDLLDVSNESITLKRGEFKSPDYIKGRRGWRISSEGNAEFRNVTIAGTLNKLVGDVLYQSSDTQRDELGAVYIKHKGITIRQPGNYRVKFTLWTNTTPSYPAYGRIYVNGAPVGIERIESAGVQTVFSEDINSLLVGDEIEVYTKATAGATAALKNFRLYVAQYDTADVTYDA